jgi:hypothetical protein
MNTGPLLTCTVAAITLLGIHPFTPAEAASEGPLWNVAWITDTQTPDCEWITALTNRLKAEKPKILIHTGDTRFEWANQCAWKDVMDLLRVETPSIEFHLAPGNHDLTNGVLKSHLRQAATRGIYPLDTGLTAEGLGYYHNRVTQDVGGVFYPIWNPDVVEHPAWQVTANKKPAHWQHPENPYHYVFKRGAIRFIVCDCFYTAEQKQWLQNILKQPDDSSVSVVLQHKHEVDHLAEYFEGLEGRHNVKLVLSGDHHQYCYEERDGITYITAAGMARGRYGDCDAMILRLFEDRLQLDRFVIPEGMPIKSIEGPETIWTCQGRFTEYKRPEYPQPAQERAPPQKQLGTVGPNLIKNGDFDNGIWYERYRGWSPSYWYQWFRRGGHVPEHAVGKRLPHSSKEYVRLHMWAHAWTGGILQNVHNVEPCHIYRLTAYGFFQPENAPEPKARIGIDPSGALAKQFSAEVSKHPAGKYDEGVGDDPKTDPCDGPYFSENTIWSPYTDCYKWEKIAVTAEAKDDTITAILYCSPKQRPAEQPIYEMNWDSVVLEEVPWPAKRLIAREEILKPNPDFKKIIINLHPELATAEVSWKTAIPSGASQVLYRFKNFGAPELRENDIFANKDFLFETPVMYEKSALFHRATIDHPLLQSAERLEFVALCRSLIDGKCVTLCSNVVSIKLANTLPIPSAGDHENWRDNIVEGASMSHRPHSPEGTLFEMQFADSDPWCYPVLELNDDEIPDSSFRGLALTVELLEGEGTIRVQFVEDNGAQYVADTNYKTALKKPQRLLATFSGTLRRPTPPDPDGRLNPEKIRKVMVGINSKHDSSAKMTVSNLEWIK